MMRRNGLAIIVSLCLGMAVLCAAEFWQKKKYSEWTPKEVQEMLNSSPWARQVEVVAGESRGGGGGLREGRAGGRPPGIGVDRQGRGGDTGTDTTAALPRTKLLIRFHAALPIKQAVARARFGDGVLSSPEAEKMLTRKEDAYLIGITGPPRLLVGDPSGFKGTAMLVIKGRNPIHAENVDVDNGEGVTTLFLAFPREPNPIKLEDDSFELQVKFRSFELKRRFKLREMVFDGNLEI